MDILSANNLSKVYGGSKGIRSTNALNGIDIAVEEGEFVGIMGPSGSGKTTLLNILSGIDKCTAGSIYVMGEEINNMNKNQMALFRRRKLGLIFQEHNLIDNLTLEENITLPLVLENRKLEEIDEKVRNIMELFNIYDIKGKYPYAVSGGQKQRTAACRALIMEPGIVLADEPTGNLDSKAAKKFMKYLELINLGRKTSILMATHDSYAASFCSRIIFIKDGRIYSEIRKKEDQRQFYNRILDSLSVLGGESYEF